MKRLVVFAVVAAAGCNAILGIDDHSLAEVPDDASSADASNDTTIDQDASLAPDGEGSDAGDSSIGADSDADADADAHTTTDATTIAAPCDLGGLEPGSPWPMSGRCPSGRSQSPLVGPDAGNFKWSVTLASGFASPAGGMTIGADGTVYVATDGDGTLHDGGVVEAVSPDSGVAWTYAPPGISMFDQAPVLASDGTLRVWDGYAQLYTVLDLDGGNPKTYVSASPSQAGMTVVTGGVTYAADKQLEIAAYDSTGTVLWHAGQTAQFTPVSVGPSGDVYSSNEVALVTALHRDGGPAWTRPIDAGGTGISPVVVAPDGTLRTTAGFDTLYAIDPKDGRLLWNDAGVALSTNGRIGGIAIADDGTTYVGTTTGLLTLGLDGGLEKTEPITDGVFKPMIDANGDVYAVTGHAANLCSFTHAGAQRWCVTLPSGGLAPVDTPVIGPNARLYVLLTDQTAVTKLLAYGP